MTLVDKERLWTKFFTANTLKWKESEADEANSEQVTMIYSPHPCSCPELEFRGIKVFSGVNDLFFHIFQRRQICKYWGIHCELSTEPILPSLSDDVPLLSWPSVGGVAGTQCYRQEGAWQGGGGGGTMATAEDLRRWEDLTKICLPMPRTPGPTLLLALNYFSGLLVPLVSLCSVILFLLLRLIFSSCHSCRHLPPITQSPLNLVTRGCSGNCSICSSLLFSRLPLLLHTKSSQPSNSTLLTLIALFFLSFFPLWTSLSANTPFSFSSNCCCPNNFDAELKFNIYKEKFLNNKLKLCFFAQKSFFKKQIIYEK